VQIKAIAQLTFCVGLLMITTAVLMTVDLISHSTKIV